MRVLITAPWGECLGGAEEMLQMAIEGASSAGHELEIVFFEPGPWPEERDARACMSRSFRSDVYVKSGARLHRSFASPGSFGGASRI